MRQLNNKITQTTTLSSQSKKEFSSLTKDQSKAISTLFEIDENIKDIISSTVNDDVSKIFN
jgi:hypothetical protein